MQTQKEGASRTGFYAAGLILLFAAQAFWHALNTNATYDESGHLAASYLMWRTDHKDYDIGHPPFIRDLFAIPLLAISPELPPNAPLPVVSRSLPLSKIQIDQLYLYGANLIYGNAMSPTALFLWPRAVNILLACLLGYWIFRWSSRLYGPAGGLASAALFALCPNLVAHGSLVTTDMGGVVFAVGFLQALALLCEREKPGRIFWTGAMLGLAAISKYSNVVLAPLFIVSYPVLSWRKERSWGELLGTMAKVLGLSWLVVCAGYGFDTVFARHALQPEDWENLDMGRAIQTLYGIMPLPDSFLRGICSVVYHSHRGHGAYLLGQYASNGWWYYFPVAFLVKTPTVTLLLICAWIVTVTWTAFSRLKKPEVPTASKSARQEIAPVLSRDEVLILLALFIFVGSAMKSEITIGLRHILLAYPLIHILLGRTAQDLFEYGKTNGKTALLPKITAGMLAAGLALEVFSVAPHYIAFFNRPSGGPDNGWKYLSDSNIDWGQDLKNLGTYMTAKGNPPLSLAYFGTAVPQRFGLIRYMGLPPGHYSPRLDDIDSDGLQREYIAISMTHLLGTYFVQHELYKWLLTRTPEAKIGYSIYVYDITEDLESRERLRDIYRLAGQDKEASRQEKLIRLLKAGKLPAAKKA